MAFSLPTFNVPCNIWHAQVQTAAPTRAPDVAGVLVNFSLGKRSILGSDSRTTDAQLQGVGIDVLLRIILLPKGTDIRGPWQDPIAFTSDCVEIPAGSGAFYWIVDVADMAVGFENEHRLAWAVFSSHVGLPSPLPGGP